MVTKDTKLWGSLSLDGIAKAKKEQPNRFKNSEKYGNQMTFDAKMWDDGNTTLSVWNKDTEERIYIGTVRISKDQSDYKAPATAEAAVGDSDLPF